MLDFSSGGHWRHQRWVIYKCKECLRHFIVPALFPDLLTSMHILTGKLAVKDIE